MAPVLEIDLKKLEENIRYEVQLLKKMGIKIMGVNKVFNGLFETAKALVNGGMQTVAESRIENLIKLQSLNCEKCLLRSPGLSEIESCIRYADLSLNSEIEILEALSLEAQKQNKKHGILLMIDMGDLREGLWYLDKAQIKKTMKCLLDLKGLYIYGLGTNFNCFGAIKPTFENGTQFVNLARELEEEFNLRFKYLSGGNCTSFHLIDKGTWPSGLNHLRIGGLHQFGIEYVETKYLEGFHHSSMPISRVVSNLYKLSAEIIELNVKPSVPHGEAGVDAFLKSKKFEDRGSRLRCLIALGRQDVPCENIWPCDEGIRIVGQTSDHTVIDLAESKMSYKLGDRIHFEIDYTALLHACNSPGIKKIYKDS